MLAAYQRTREKSGETLEAQVELAQWCADKNLVNQARAHWSRVLQMKPGHAAALQWLGPVAGASRVTDRDMQVAMAAAEKWVPRLTAISNDMVEGDPRHKEKALQELTAIRDPDAVLAIDVVLCLPGRELTFLGIEMLKRIQTPLAAAVLARYAVVPSPPVQQAAATGLCPQEKYDYVPLLLEHGQSLIQTSPGSDVGARRGWCMPRRARSTRHRTATSGASTRTQRGSRRTISSTRIRPTR